MAPAPLAKPELAARFPELGCTRIGRAHGPAAPDGTRGLPGDSPFSIPSKRLGVLDGMENPRVTPGCGLRGSSAPKVRSIPAWAARPRDGAGGESRTKGPSHPQRFPRGGPPGDPGRWIGPSALLVSRCFLPGPHGPGWHGAGLWPLWKSTGGSTWNPGVCGPERTSGFSIPSRTPRRLDGMENLLTLFPP